MLAIGAALLRRCTRTVFSALLIVSATAPAQTPKKLHAASGSTPHVKVDVNQPFTQEMGDNSGLDKDKPQLSSDGLHYGTDSDGQKLASTECLIDETIVAQKNSLSPEAISKLCLRLNQTGNTTIASVKSNLKENGVAEIDNAIVHLVKWDKGKPDGSWYQYSRNKGHWSGKIISQHNDALTQVDHLLGKGNVAFLALHLGIDDTCKISYDLEAKHTRPLNEQDLSDLIQLAESYVSGGKSGAKSSANSGTATPGIVPEAAPPPSESQPTTVAPASRKTFWGVWGGVTVLTLPTLPASITFSPSAGNAKSLQGIKPYTREGDGSWNVTTSCQNSPPDHEMTSSASLDPHQSASGSRVEARLRPANFILPSSESYPLVQQAGGGTAQRKGAPATAQPSDQSASKDPLSGLNVTVPNETLYWWDVSVAMPVTSFNQLTYNSTDNLVVLKKTNDIKPYALFDFFPGGADLKAKNYLSMLKLTAGVPMAGKPLQKSFVGTGFTIGIGSFRFQPIVGLRIEKDQRTTTLMPGSSANQAQLTNDLNYQWHAKLQVMIGFSVADAKKVLGLK
jgi:hypothetical protein